MLNNKRKKKNNINNFIAYAKACYMTHGERVLDENSITHTIDMPEFKISVLRRHKKPLFRAQYMMKISKNMPRGIRIVRNATSANRVFEELESYSYDYPSKLLSEAQEKRLMNAIKVSSCDNVKYRYVPGNYNDASVYTFKYDGIEICVAQIKYMHEKHAEYNLCISAQKNNHSMPQMHEQTTSDTRAFPYRIYRALENKYYERLNLWKATQHVK